MLRKKIGLVALTAVLSASALVGCGGSDDKKADAGKSEVKGNITAVGSSALQPLVEAAGSQFTEKNPNVKVNVQGGGSGQGLSQIAAGTVQIGNSDVFAEEKKIKTDKIEDNKVAVVGMGPVVNKEVKVDNLTSQQLADIFTGKIKNWKEVGGEDKEIVVINRAEGSGTRATFEKFALNGQQSVKAQEQDNSGSVQKIVAQTPGSISYLAFSYFNDSVKALKIDGVEPKAENIADNKWKIWSYEHMYTQKNPDEATKAFIEYMKSDDVQKELVSKLGYISINQMKIERDADGKISEVK